MAITKIIGFTDGIYISIKKITLRRHRYVFNEHLNKWILQTSGHIDLKISEEIRAKIIELLGKWKPNNDEEGGCLEFTVENGFVNNAKLTNEPVNCI